jgi:hypothetical protein
MGGDDGSMNLLRLCSIVDTTLYKAADHDFMTFLAQAGRIQLQMGLARDCLPEIGKCRLEELQLQACN